MESKDILNKSKNEEANDSFKKSENNDDTNIILDNENEDIKVVNQFIQAEQSLKDSLDKIISFKKEGNEHFKNKNYNEAITSYNIGIEKLEESMASYDKKIQNESIKILQKSIIEEKVNVLSNMSTCYLKLENYQQAFNLDLSIIRQFNPSWDKSYNRIIIASIKNNDLMLANQYAHILKMQFPQEIVDKYKGTFEDLENENKNHLERIKTKKNQEESECQSTLIKDSDSRTINSSNNKSTTKVVKTKKSKLNLNWLLGSVFLIGSTVGLFFLFNSRRKFLK